MNKTAFLCALSAGTLWGIMGFFTRNLSANFSFTSLQITSLRLVVAALTFMVTSLIGNRERFRIKLRDIPLLCAMGVSGLMMLSLTYFLSITYSSMAVAASLMYTAPAIVIIASRILFGEKLTVYKFISLIAAFVGCCFVSGLIDKNDGGTVIGVVFGLLAGVFYASYSIFGTYALRKYDSGTATMWAFACAALVSLIFIDLPDFSAKVIASSDKLRMFALIIGMGVFTGFFPFLLYTASLERTEASKAVIIASVEPLVAALTGFIAFGETLTLYSSIGIILILISVVLTTKQRS